MKRCALQAVFASFAVITACSSGSTGTGGAGGMSSASSTSTTSTTSSTTASSSSGTGGVGGSAPVTCATCVVVAALPAGSRPYGIALDATHVYWTNTGTGEVMQADKDGSAKVTIASGQEAPHALTVQGGQVIWGLYAAIGALRKAPIGGGPSVDLLPLAPAVLEVVANDSYVWWTREPDDVQRVPFNGLPDGGVEDLLTGNPLANGLAFDGTNIFWANRQDGYVKRGDIDLSNETTLGIGDVPWGVAVDGSRIYWTEQGSAPKIGKVMTASKADGADAKALATEQASPQGIAVDDTSVYWANRDDGTINKVPLAGGSVTVVAAGQATPIKIALDASHVYWANYDGDAIMKAPK
ncbi:Putative serine/threonine-protein kinase pknH [Minicystis rosea]|nr:Putative serine/threonine-protein kinase pknH [Minicystis rosea]